MSGQDGDGRHAERRHLTTLFSDLSDSTALASSVDPEEYAVLLEQLNRTFEQVIRRHGGTLLQMRGDGVLAVFGLEAREDEGRRATEAALELHQAVRNISFPTPLPEAGLTLHSGIHSGLVLAIEGDELLGRLALVGEAANLASRLSDMAEPDEVLASELALGVHRHFFHTGPPQSLSFKGVAGPVTVYPVLGRAEIRTHYEARSARSQAPLVGRERELSTLREQYARCVAGTAQAVSIVAPPGLGKTRLAEEFFKELEDEECLILRGYCESYLNAEPLQPVLHMLRQVLKLSLPIQADHAALHVALVDRLDTLAPGLATQADTFAAMLAPSSTSAYPSDEAMSAAVAALVRALAHDRPLVVFIDDWQWADDSTRAVLRTTPELADLRLLLVRSSRDRAPPRQSTAVIHLQPLGSSHSEAMISTLLTGVDRNTIELVRQASGGNPLFIEELCHAVARDARTLEVRESWPSAVIPNSLSSLIVSRIAQLDVPQREALERLAVMGNVVPAWLLESAANAAGIRDAVPELTALDLVFPGESEGSLRFKHGITRDVILHSLGRDERRALHLQVARSVETRFRESEREGVFEMLAYHYGETGEYSKAADYAEAAGNKALAASAMDRARAQYQAALRALGRFEPFDDATYQRWMAIARQLALACLFDAEPEQLVIYQHAAELARTHNDRANETYAEYWSAYINYAMGEAAKAMAHIDRAHELVKSLDDEPLRTQILATWGQVRANACDYAAALPAIDDALARQAPFKRRPRIAYPYAYSLAAKAMVFGDQGRFDDAYACLDEADELTLGPIHAIQGSITSMRAAVYLWQGRWQEALDTARMNEALGDRMGSRYISAMGTALAGYARWHLDPDASIDSMARALSWVEGNHQMIWTSLHFSWLCELLVKLGRYQEARRSAVWVLRRARKLERLGESVAYCALAELPAERGAAVSAERCFGRARASADLRRSERELTLIDLKEAAHFEQRNRRTEGLAALSGCRERFSKMGMYWYAAAAQRLELKLAQL